MLQGGYFIGGVVSGGQSSEANDVYLENGEIIFSPVDPIRIDDDGSVFFSVGDKNAYMYFDENGKVFVRRVK